MASGYLRHARGLHYRGATLALGEPRGFLLIGVDTAKGFSIGVIYCDQEMVVTAPAIFAEL